MRRAILLLSVLLFGLNISAQKRIINLPEIPGYLLLKCDFHIHTVFSDGEVWPVYRVNEAWKDGLDVLAISDHLEYQPKREYIPTDHNAAWKIAKDAADQKNLILIHATEITRGMPPGHFNALFIDDATPINREDPFEAIEEAINQGAYIQWNHPGWRAQEEDGIPKIYDIHKRLFEKGYIHGIEFFNETEYYPNILEWCSEMKLAVIASSDEHEIISERHIDVTRPMTILFARERTAESVKEALMDARSLAYFNNTLAGPERLLLSFFENAVSVGEPYHENERYRWVEITNSCDVPFTLADGPGGVATDISLEANSITILRIPKDTDPELRYRVVNMLTGYEEYLQVTLK
jgi:hypothetical protein